MNECLYKNMLAYFCTAASEHRAKPVSERAKLLSVHCEARKGEDWHEEGPIEDGRSPDVRETKGLPNVHCEARKSEDWHEERQYDSF